MKLVEFSFGTNFNRYAYLSIVLCNFQTDYPVFKRKAACPINLYFTCSKDCHELLIKYPQFMESRRFERQTILL